MVIRRGKKEGTIYKRPNGNWRAQISIEGKRLSFSGKTQSECRQWLQQTHQNVSAGLSYASSKVTFGEFLQSWLSTIKARLRRGTFSQYSQIVNHYVSPEIGRVKISDLKPDRIQRLYDLLISKGKSRRTVQIVHAVVHRSLNQAVRLGLLPLNPDDATSPPKPDNKEMQVFDQTQAQKLLITAKGKGLSEFVFYFFVLVTGVRQGELLGLKWEDIDFSKKTVKILRQVKPLPGGGFEFVPPKTKNGYRTVKIGDETVSLLQQHYSILLEKSKASKQHWRENGLVFPSVVGTPINPPNLTRGFRAILREAGLPKVRFHDLRHTAASLMLNNGVDVLVVSRRLGHSKPSITLDIYGHLIPSTHERTAELMEGLVNPIFVQELHPTAPELHPIANSVIKNR